MVAVAGYTYLEAATGKVKSLFFSCFFLVESNSYLVGMDRSFWKRPISKYPVLACGTIRTRYSKVLNG